VRTRRAVLARQLEQSKVPAAETALAVATERAAAAERKLADAIVTRDQAAAGVGDLALAEAEVSRTAGEITSAKAAITGMERSLAERAGAVRAKLAAAQRGVDTAVASEQEARRRNQAAIEETAKQEGRLSALKLQWESADALGAQAKLDAARTALGGPGRPVGAAEIEAAALARDQRAGALERSRAELHKAQGALEQVGGAVAGERLRDLEDALRLAEQQEADVGAEFDAWKLLRETMVEAEAAQASHLGQALAPLVGERFNALTASRYGRVAMNAQLATEGVMAGGEVRPVERLSVGTRDQLSTLYRLCLAERLQTTVVLDDQLVHSDVARLDWFRTLLREKAEAFQIVVLTCRPGDYVVGGSLAPSDGVSRDLDGGMVRLVDLRVAMGG
jgi:hypothetical protein